MLLIRDIMYCKPGKVRPMIEKYRAMGQAKRKNGPAQNARNHRPVRRVSEVEVESLEAFMAMMDTGEDMKEFEEIMKDYHELVDHGRREIYNIEL